MAASTHFSSVTLPVKSLTSATYTVDAGDAGKTLVLNRASGITVTLPDATGTGKEWNFVVGTALDSASHVIRVADSNNTMKGVAYLAHDTSNVVTGWPTTSTSDTITMNGTTTGGIVGARVCVIDFSENTLQVNMFSNGTGTAATPFSAAV
jgi:hypothetical protein